MWSQSRTSKGALNVPAESSPTCALTNTVCVSDPDGKWPVVQADAVKELSEFGEIARLDASLGVVARCILVTYFDVRAAQRLLLSSPGRVEPFPAAAHDCRIVRVELAAFSKKVPNVEGGFSQFGEVANISASLGVAIVEFYDMRAAQMLLAASRGTASPHAQDDSSAPLFSEPNGLAASAGLGKAMGFEESAESGKGKQDRAAANRPVRCSKVSTKDFSKFDIDADRILRGEDPRTTVMVRNIMGVTARTDFLDFLDKCLLGDRFTFFYMPCKEHKNIPAGYAFINFISPMDVHNLFMMVRSGFWSEFMNDPQTKAPGVSYARFQGHEDLMKHFSSSAVIHEPDPEKRPIFRPEAAAKAAQERLEKRGKLPMGAQKVRGCGLPNSAKGPGNSTPPGLDGFANGLGSFGGLGAADLAAAFLNRTPETTSSTPSEGAAKDTPAYLPFGMSSPAGSDPQHALQLLLAAKSVLDSAYYSQQQMGA
eukprot:TRINITY_DN7159_c0_g1_i1.p1 TRINITY_DN7159_c0_g1~~TRINITY_DN7159_c0_g1_i1.p1  ORF type:complete len:482 (-),score=88.42 TRINITY_DN7159_c0_g1_i1:74-1519(-)